MTNSKTTSQIRAIRVRRKEAARMLACSISSVKRREREGLLTPLRDVRGGGVYYPWHQVAALSGYVIDGGEA
jgi:hypothetical protein